MKTLDSEAIADVIVQTLKDVIAPRDACLVALEARLAALEQKPFVTFLGTFERGTAYDAGAAVVHKSALWICKTATSGEPGQDFIGWQLAVKRGDAR
jgi:hypothetical protein